MPEQIPIRHPSAAEHFAIAARVMAKQAGKEFSVPNGRGYIEVSLVVDGVEVPFAETIEEIYRRLHDQVNEKAAQLAYEKLSGNEIYKLAETMRGVMTEVDGKLRDAVKDIFGVDVDSD